MAPPTGHRGMAIPSWTVSEPLRPHLRSMAAYDMTLPGAGTHIGAPSTGVTLVLPLHEPLDVAWARRDDSRRSMGSCVSGLHLAPAVIRHGGRQRGIQLMLTALGARVLLGVPAGALAGELLDLRDVVPTLGDLTDRLHEAAGWRERLALVDRALLARLHAQDAPAVRPDLARALDRLASGARVAETAAEVGLSRRRIGTLVSEACGVGPKEYQRLARFERARPRVADAVVRGQSLATVAGLCGYADQAHLTREWRQMVGLSPRRWALAEFPFLQDAAPRTARD